MVQVFIWVENKIICDATFGHFRPSTYQEVNLFWTNRAILKKITIVLVLLLGFQSLKAQEKEGYWGLAVGLRSQTVQDQLITRSR